MNTRMLIALVVAGFTVIAQGCGDTDEAPSDANTTGGAAGTGVAGAGIGGASSGAAGKGGAAGSGGTGKGGSAAGFPGTTGGMGGAGMGGAGMGGMGLGGSQTGGAPGGSNGTGGISGEAGNASGGTSGTGGASGGPIANGPAMGTNLSGMEWAAPGLRYGQSTLPNVNFTVPRAAEVKYLAASGFTRNRLPIQWELLQPMLHDTFADANARSAIGEPGAFHPGYEAYITGVLDAHAAAGTKAIIDCHNYCRYQDFRYQADGSIVGLQVTSDPLLRPYTSDPSQVQVRICALAEGATLDVSDLTDFWTRVASRWKDHPGLGGYGLMNEPHDLPVPGGTEPSSGGEDLTIWPTFAQAAIEAIRAVDPDGPIYVSGNQWDAAMAIATANPGYPLAGANLVYEVHLYLDAFSNGFAFDYDTEVAKGFSAGFGAVPIDANTGHDRLKIATDWAKANGVRLALTEVGMPIDDARWEEELRRTVALARQEGVEVYTWMGGNHWPMRNYALNQAPGWHQDRTLEPAVSGLLKESAGIAQATLHDDGTGYALPGDSVTITVYARGSLASPLTLTVASNDGGALDKSVLTIPAGANGQDTYTFTPGASGVATLTYTSDGQLGGQVPPPRKVYSLADPAGYASTDLKDAAMAILARYAASKWEMADGYTDYVLGAPAGDGQPVRAIADSGYGSSVGNAMEMLNWLNTDAGGMGPMIPPVMRVIDGKKCSDHAAADSFGFWCKKSAPIPGVQENPRNRIPYGIEDAHFAIAAVSIAGANSTGVVFQASKAEESYTAELTFVDGRPQAHWLDGAGQSVELTSPSAAVTGSPLVVTMASASGTQTLRVDAATVGTGSATFAPSVLNQMLIGSGFLSYYPRAGFGGRIYSVITGKGAPTPGEVEVLERYLATTAGLTLLTRFLQRDQVPPSTSFVRSTFSWSLSGAVSEPTTPPMAPTTTGRILRKRDRPRGVIST
jgi:endoglucanase